jgi:hypothetical protein
LSAIACGPVQAAWKYRKGFVQPATIASRLGTFSRPHANAFELVPAEPLAPAGDELAVLRDGVAVLGEVAGRGVPRVEEAWAEALGDWLMAAAGACPVQPTRRSASNRPAARFL